MLNVVLFVAMLLEGPNPVFFERQNLDESIDQVRFDAKKVPYWSKVRGYTFVWCVKAGADPRQLRVLSGAPSGDSISIVGEFTRVDVNVLPAIGGAHIRTYKP